MAEEVGFEPTERVQAAQTISSRSRYDHFDTPPYSVFDVLSEKGENYTRELVIFRKRALRFLPVTTGIFSGQPSSKAMAFRVLFALGTFVSAVVGGGSFENGENPCAATDFGRADRY